MQDSRRMATFAISQSARQARVASFESCVHTAHRWETWTSALLVANGWRLTRSDHPVHLHSGTPERLCDCGRSMPRQVHGLDLLVIEPALASAISAVGLRLLDAF